MDWKSLVDSTAPLDSKQRGHLRHFFNLANAPDGVWDTMGAQLPGQEWLDSYRYQLAEMVYGAGLAHFHRLPAARGPFKELIGRLIGKMLRREVWDYWWVDNDYRCFNLAEFDAVNWYRYLTSKSGVRVNPDIKELREGWADPVKDENISWC